MQHSFGWPSVLVALEKIIDGCSTFAVEDTADSSCGSVGLSNSVAYLSAILFSSGSAAETTMDVPLTIVGSASTLSMIFVSFSSLIVVFASAVRLSLSSSSSSDGTRINKSVGLFGSFDRSSELLTRSSLSSSEKVKRLDTRECGVPPIRPPPSDGDNGLMATETPESVTTGDAVVMFRFWAILFEA